MAQYKYLIAGLILSLAGCRGSGDQVASGGSDSTRSSRINSYFPVADFIRGEILLVDSTPVGFIKYQTLKGKTDTSYVKTPEFDRLAREFLDPAITDTAQFAANFKESAFIDQSTQSATFTYAAKSDKPGLRRVDVLASQDPRGNQVKSIYMEKSESMGDTTIDKKMIWKAKHFFQIVTIRETQKSPPITEEIKLVWASFE